MKLAKILICITLSFSFLIVGAGFALPNSVLDFTGEISFQHTGLFISDVSTHGNVNISGYSGTLLTLTAEEGNSMIVSITNPLSDPYYYLNYTAGDHTLTVEDTDGDPFELATAVNPGETVNLVVTFPDIDHAHSVKFNFTLIPPVIDVPNSDPDDPDDPDDGNDDKITTNATAAVDFIINHVSRGLNSNNNKHTFEQWCDASNRILHCRDNTVSGGNLNNEFSSIGAGDVYFTMEWVHAMKYNVYLYYAIDAEGNGNLGKYLIAYKQEVIFNSIDNLWVNGDSFKGYAKIVREKNGNGIEIGEDSYGNDCVVWYDSLDKLPNGAVLVSSANGG